MKAKHILYVMGVVFSGLLVAGNVGALTAQEDVDFYFTFDPSIGLSLSSNALTIDNLAPGNAAKSSDITLTVSSNSTYGYKLLATVGDGDTYTNNKLVNGNSVFDSLALNANVALNSMSDSTWGYTKDGTSFYGLPYVTGTPAEIVSTSAAGDSTTSFAIGAKAASTQVSGEYSNVINFALVSNVIASSINEVSVMQEFAMMSSANKSSVTSSMVTGAYYSLTDIRNSAEYQIVKLASGDVWMNQNLQISGVINATDSNFLVGTYTVENISSGFYNYCNVSAGTVCDAEDTTVASMDICPAGWRLPTSSELSAITTSDNLAYSMNYSTAAAAQGDGFAVRCVLK